MKRISLSQLSSEALSYQQEESIKGGFGCSCTCAYICPCSCTGTDNLDAITELDEDLGVNGARQQNNAFNFEPVISDPVV